MKGGAQDQSGLLAIEGEEAQEAGEVALMSAAARPSRKRWSSVAGSLVALGIVLCLLRARVPGPEHTLKETGLSNVASLANASAKAPTCSGIEPTNHYPLPPPEEGTWSHGTWRINPTYTEGLPSPLVAHPSGMTMCDVEKLQRDCVEQINVFRAGAPFSDGRSRDHGHLDPLQLAPEDFRKCMNEKASSDQLYSAYKGQEEEDPDAAWFATGGCGHYTFGLDCGLNRFAGGENSCCSNKCDSYDDCKQKLLACLQGMFDEGMVVLDTGSTDCQYTDACGHYWNMVGMIPGLDYKYAACGFGFDSDGGMLATQNFLPDPPW